MLYRVQVSLLFSDPISFPDILEGTEDSAGVVTALMPTGGLGKILSPREYEASRFT